MNASKECSSALLSEAIGSFIVSQAICVAAKLSIADKLVHGPKTALELAQEAGVHPRALYRFLRALSTVGIFEAHGDQTFSLNPAASLLRSDIPGSLRPWALLAGDECIRRPWSEVMYSVETNEPAFEKVFGLRPYEYMGTNPATARLFDEAMKQGTYQSLDAVLYACDFSRFQSIVDVGGGDGTFLSEILNAHPTARGILLELPALITAVEQRPPDKRLPERCQPMAGDFFESIPPADACVLKWILHNWDDDRAVRILKNCRSAVPEDGRVLIIERIVSASPGCAAAILDLNMLVTHGGLERTEDEYRVLLKSAGLHVIQIRNAGVLSVIEASRARETI